MRACVCFLLWETLKLKGWRHRITGGDKSAGITGPHEMLRCLTPQVLVWVVMVTATLCQSGDWGAGGGGGSGFDVPSVAAAANSSLQEAGDEPERSREEDQFPSAVFPWHVRTESGGPDACSVRFGTATRRPRAQWEELGFLQALQRANGAVVDNLEQYVEAEVGGQSYGDVIAENVAAVREEQESCRGAVQQAEEDLRQRLEGDVSGIISGMKKLREESRAFEEMLRATADVAHRLEVSSQALHAAFTRQLKGVSVNVRRRKHRKA